MILAYQLAPKDHWVLRSFGGVLPVICAAVVTLLPVKVDSALGRSKRFMQEVGTKGRKRTDEAQAALEPRSSVRPASP